MFENPEAIFGGTKQLLSVIELIYSTVEDVSLWPTVIDRIAEAVGSEQTIFVAPLHSTQLPPALSSSQTRPEVLPLYLGHYQSVNVLADPCDRMFATGKVRYSHWAVPDGEFERSEFYNDFFHPLDMHYSCGLKIPLDGEAPAYMSNQRAKSKGGFQEQEGAVLELLMPHLQRALTLHLQFVRMESSVHGLEAALDRFDHAVFGINKHGHVIFFNRKGEEVASKGDGLRLFNGFLVAAHPEQDRALQAILSAAVLAGNGNGLSSGGFIRLERSSAAQELRVTVMPFFCPLPQHAAQLSALVFVSDSEQRAPSRSSAMRALFALTPAETRIADLLLEGLDAREIANQLRLTIETTRFHVKRILAKTGTRRQAELLKLMLSLPRTDCQSRP